MLLSYLLFLILFTFIGIGLGIITGLVPGIHVNTISALIIAFQPVFVTFALALLSPFPFSLSDALLLICALIFAMLITHTFLDFIPSVFLGVPEEDTALTILPAHRMMLRGRGYEAIRYSAFGSMASVLIALLFILPARLIMASPLNGYEKLRPFIPFLLIFVATVMITSEKGEERMCKHFMLRAKAENVRSAWCVDEVPLHLYKYYGQEVEVSGTLLKSDNGMLFISVAGQEIPVFIEGNLQPFVHGDKISLRGKVVPRLRNRDHLRQMAIALLLFLMSGYFGILILSTPIMTHNFYVVKWSLPNMILFPTFTGLFGLSGLFLSLIGKTQMPEQKLEDTPLTMPKARKLRGALAGTAAGTLVGWFPGVSSGVAAVVARSGLGGGEDDDAPKEYIIAISGVNTSNAIFGLIALFVIAKTRSGAMSAIRTILGTIPTWEQIADVPSLLLMLLFSAVIASLTAYFLTLYLGKIFARIYNAVPYTPLTCGIIILLLLLIILFTGIIGLIIALIGTAIGMLPTLTGVKKVHLMGVLMIPVIIFLLGLEEEVMHVLMLW